MENKRVSFKRHLTDIKKEKIPLKKTNLQNLQKKSMMDIPSPVSSGLPKYSIPEEEKDEIKEIPQIDLINIEKASMETKIEKEVDITKIDDDFFEDIDLDTVFSDIVDKYKFEINMVGSN